MPTITPLSTILSWFQTGDFPTEPQFAASWSSFYHKDELIPMDKVISLNSTLQNKTDKLVYEAHLTNSDAHVTTLAKLDASNLNAASIQAWKSILSVGELPSNIATVDDLNNNLYGNVWSKQQSDVLYMIFDEFVLNGKIMASKIEALGLTELVTVTETTLAAFMSNNANYTYEKNDMIAIPDGAGNYSLYIYTGGSKITSGSYIPTGLSNITIAMVEGLQGALDAKMNKPTAAGNYFVNHNTITSYRAINPLANYLLFWNDTDFIHSDIYNNSGKYGIGTTVPSEMVHLNNGRVRTKSVVFDANTETLPNQLTFDGSKFLGTNSSGVKRPLQYSDYNGMNELWSSLTDAQWTNLKTIANGGWTTGTMSAAVVSPPVVDRANKPTWIALKGANLNLPPQNFKIELCTETSTVLNPVVVAEVPGSQVQLYTNGVDLSFWFNFSTIPAGKYKIRLWNGVAHYLTGANTILQVIETITPFTPTLDWTFAEYTPNTGTMVGGNSSITYNSSSANKAYQGSDLVTVSCAKSSELFSAADNFYLRIGINVTNVQVGYDNNTPFTIGLCNTNDVISLNDLSVVKGRGTINFRGGGLGIFPDLGSQSVSIWATYVAEVAIMRNNGLFTIIVTMNNSTSIYTKSAPSIPLSLFALVGNSPSATTVSFNLLEKYKF